jgi:hypothetical protein
MDHVGSAVTAAGVRESESVEADTQTPPGPARPARMAVAALGAGLLAAVASGRAGLYVRGYFVPVLAVTGVALLLVAWLRPPRLSRRAWAVLLLPLVVAMGIGPHQAATLSQGQLSGGLGARLGDGPNPLLAGGGGVVSVLQVQLAAEQVGPVALMGRDVVVDAVVASPSSVERLVMVCCAADARPVILSVAGIHLPARGRWVEIHGHLSASDGRVVLDASGVRVIPVPTAPIL